MTKKFKTEDPASNDTGRRQIENINEFNIKLELFIFCTIN